MAAPPFTPDSLPKAVKALFEVNNYTVDGPMQIHGAEIDLRARSKMDPFAPPIYIEVTIEHVGVEKYGKDLTKFALIREAEPDAQCLLVSSKGFALPTAERAGRTRIQALTYQDLFRKFEQFERYVASITTHGALAEETSALAAVYVEPHFEDASGRDVATDYLSTWRLDQAGNKRWLIIVGEYGTGKTALTKILLRRWMDEYQHNPDLPLPLRIELRDFTRQFDARTLLHHFLDKSGLGHISIDFVLSLIRTGRVTLLLDGYDEMAHYMHARERRTCLEALAELSSAGAHGILTSRPNYFSEAEEFRVAEILYDRFKNQKSVLGDTEREVLDSETRLDELLQAQFINRFERQLQDLDEPQTEALVRRVLASDPAASTKRFFAL